MTVRSQVNGPTQGGRRRWRAAFLAVLVGGLFVLQWLTFRPPRGADLEILARVGAFWIVLLAMTGLGYGRGKR